MTDGLHGHPETLADMAGALRDEEHVVDVWKHDEFGAYLEVELRWPGIPPNVARLAGKADMTLDVDGSRLADDDAIYTVAVVRHNPR